MTHAVTVTTEALTKNGWVPVDIVRTFYKVGGRRPKKDTRKEVKSLLVRFPAGNLNRRAPDQIREVPSDA